MKDSNRGRAQDPRDTLTPQVPVELAHVDPVYSEAAIEKFASAVQATLDQPLFDNGHDASLDDVAQQVVARNSKSLAIDLVWNQRLAGFDKVRRDHQVGRAASDVDAGYSHRPLGFALRLGLISFDGPWSRPAGKVEIGIRIARKALRDFSVEVDELCAARFIE